MQTVLLAAAGSTRYDYVSPLVVLDEIVELCKQASLYEFLRQDVQPGGYHDHKKLVDVARGRLFDRIDDEVRAAVGLVEESRVRARVRALRDARDARDQEGEGPQSRRPGGWRIPTRA